jgi:phage-related protein
MLYRIEFYNAAVRERIEAWPAGVAASFAAITLRMVDHGPDLGMPYTRALGQGLFEIRARGREGIGRAFFCTRVARRIVVLHGFVKKSQKTPLAELRIARARMKEIVDD